MQHYTNFHDPELLDGMRKNQIGVIPTDTQYGVVGKALAVPVVDRIYQLRQRDEHKPMIILIPTIEDLQTFFVDIDTDTTAYLENLWPAKVSVILPCHHEAFEYLHRGTNSLAFRIPDHQQLRELLSDVGPIVAPSANMQHQSPATTVKEAQDYFDTQVDFYLDGGVCDSPPSTIIKIVDGSIEIIRHGAVEVTTNITV